MDAQQIIEYIRTAPKKTPVKVYVWEKAPVDFPGPAAGFSPLGRGARSFSATGRMWLRY